MDSAFKAQFKGLCHPCGDEICKGDFIVRHEEHGYVHEECVNDATLPKIEPAESNGADFDAFNRGRTPGIAVLPRGTTGKDACSQCFMVHSPGQEGCE